MVGWVLPLIKHGMSGARPSTLVTGQMYREGRCWLLLAESYNIGTPKRCMTLSVSLIGSNVLKFTKDTSLCFFLSKSSSVGHSVRAYLLRLPAQLCLFEPWRGFDSCLLRNSQCSMTSKFWRRLQTAETSLLLSIKRFRQIVSRVSCLIFWFNKSIAQHFHFYSSKMRFYS